MASAPARFGQRLGRGRAVVVRGIVGPAHIKRDQPRMLRTRVAQQLERLRKDRVVAGRVLPRHRRIGIGRELAALPRPAAGEVQRRAAHALALGRFPQGLAARVPVGIGAVIVMALLGIDEGIGDDAVVLGPAPGFEGGVVDERDRRERRHEMVRPSPFPRHAVEIGRLGRLHHRRREAVEQHDDNRPLRRLRARAGQNNPRRHERGGNAPEPHDPLPATPSPGYV